MAWNARPWFATVTEFVRHGFDIELQCWNCKRKSCVDAAALEALCKEKNLDPSLFRLGKRLACKECGMTRPHWTVADWPMGEDAQDDGDRK